MGKHTEEGVAGTFGFTNCFGQIRDVCTENVRMVGRGKVLPDTFSQLDVALCDNVEELWASGDGLSQGESGFHNLFCYLLLAWRRLTTSESNSDASGDCPRYCGTVGGTRTIRCRFWPSGGFSPCVAKLRNPTSENLRCEPGRRTGDTAFGHDEKRSKEGSTTNRQSLVKREHVARTFFSVLSVSRTFNFRI